MENVKKIDFVGMVVVANNMKEAILGCDSDEIWGCVTAGDDITREKANAAIDICKEKFKDQSGIQGQIQDIVKKNLKKMILC